ncbi:MAG TPA: phosphoribosyltransferase family protein [Chitinophagaceae bacterium]|nr:phosphoribosyltransferase family protein [Chitinophagaceae bacterium]
MISAKEIKESILHLLFPNVCAGCGNDRIRGDSLLCPRCIEAMPQTNFEWHVGNPVEKKFWGRLRLTGAMARYYFTRESLMQQLMHEFKYRGNVELGLQLGKLMGAGLLQSGRFTIDALVPLPLFASKEKRRGFNQASILCNGIAGILKVPVLTEAISRSTHTDTQTKKGRIDRWLNLEGKFVVNDPPIIKGRHLLLVDDVVTTGATLEACGSELLKVAGVQLSIATLCYAAR